MARTASAPRGQRYYVTVEYQNFGGQSQIPPMAAVGGELEFNKIGEGDAALTGQATFARVVAMDGTEVFSCDVGTVDSDAVIKLGTVQISAGAPVRLSSFRLSMP